MPSQTVIRHALTRRAGTFTLILTSASMSLLLSGCGVTAGPSTTADLNGAVGVAANEAPAVAADSGINADASVVVNAPAPSAGAGATAAAAVNAGTKAPTPKMPSPAPAVAKGGSYKDGTYHATGNYMSPAGSESIEVSVTLRNDIVVDANVTSDATMSRSMMMQQAFISGYKPMVVGKNIAEVNVGKVSGSSLTPMGFNAAIATIKAEAAK